MKDDYDNNISDEDIERAIISGELDNNNSNSNKDIYSEIELQNKLVEADDSLSLELANRNFQLGNISKEEYNVNLGDVDYALKCINMPYENGGFFLHSIGFNIFKRLDIAHIMSGSKGAKKWDSLTQQKKVNVIESNNSKNTGVMGIFKRKK